MFQIRDEFESEANLKVLTKELKKTMAVLKDRVKVELLNGETLKAQVHELKDKLVGKSVFSHQMQASIEVKMDSEDKFKTLLKFVAQHKDMFTQVSNLSGSHEWQNI